MRTGKGLSTSTKAGHELGLGLNDTVEADADLIEIAEEMGISKQRVQQLLKSALFKCLVALTERDLTFEDLCPSGHSNKTLYHLQA